MANGAQDVLEAEHDDIFLLRYVLSYKTTAKSETHVRAGIAFRKENAWLEYAKTGQVWEVSRHSVNLRSAPLNFFFFFSLQVNTKVERFTCASQSHNRKLDGGPIQYIRACIADPGVLAKNVTGKGKKISDFSDFFFRG